MKSPWPGQVGHGEPGVIEIHGLSKRETEGEHCEGDQEKESQAHIDAVMISHRGIGSKWKLQMSNGFSSL